MHRRRPFIDWERPMHITIKVRDRERYGHFRHSGFRPHFRRAIRNAHDKGLHIIHFSVQMNHIHFLVETESRFVLHRALKSLNTTLAIALKRFRTEVLQLKNERGRVFQDRYHLHVLHSPRATRNALRYVLLNSAKHLRSPRPTVCLHSTAALFREWGALFGNSWRAFFLIPKRETILAARARLTTLELSAPVSELLRVRWREVPPILPFYA